LIEMAIPTAERLVNSLSPDEEAYLIELSGLIERQKAIPKAFFNFARPVAMHESLRRFPLLVLQFRLAPGAAIPYHDHRDYNGVLTVTEGAVRIRSFEILGSDPQPLRGHTFEIRETSNAMLTKGAQSTLSRTRDNIHDVRAGPEGARFVDFFTLFRQGAHSVSLNVSEQPRDAAKRIFEASWA
jgi:predicted metal-dependent enzyme (double-stranded beta helix superfamily)